MPEWTIKGEAGKALNENTVMLKDVVVDELSVLTFRSQQADTFEFFIISKNPEADPPYLPEHMQRISVFKDGVQWFTGEVIEPEFRWSGGKVGWQVKCTGGWSELEKVPLAPDNKAYERPQGDLTATLLDILTIAKNGNAKIIVGTVHDTFNTLRFNMRSMTCGTALAEALHLIPDAVVQTDYSGGGYPVINILRRPFMDELPLVLGVSEVEECNITPMSGLTPDRVTVTYALANTNGIVIQQTLTAGSGTISNQSVVIAESGFDEFTAQAIAGQVVINTTDLTTGVWSVFVNSDAKLAEYCATNNVPAFLSTSGTYNDQNAPTLPSSFFSVTFDPPKYTGDDNASTAGFYVLGKGEYREWFSKLGINKLPASLKATFHLTGTGTTLPAWAAGLPVAGLNTHQGFAPNNSTGKWAIWFLVDFKVTLISRLTNADATLRDPGDYEFTAPPSDLAASLLAVQSYVPFKGNIRFTPHGDNTRKLGKKVNIIGASPRLKTAGAVIQEETFTLHDNRQSLTLGTPSRQYFHDLMSRFRRATSK